MSDLIAVDIGNSSTKFALFTSAESSAGLPQPDWTHSLAVGEAISRELFALLPGRARWRVVSVHRASETSLANWVRTQRPSDDYRCLGHRELPLSVDVQFPDRVGMDRLAAAVAANVIRQPVRPAIVIDAGSAVTVDLVSADGAFQGGVILPGFRMSARALAGADLLPEVLLKSTGAAPVVLGKNTEEAIRSGLFWGTVGAVREIIARYAESYPEPQIFVTGGDLERLAPLVGSDAQFVPHLVLAGIAVASMAE